MTLLPDDVWRRLDPYHGSLSRRASRLIALAVVSSLLLAASALVLRHSGVIRPNLANAHQWGGHGAQFDFATREVGHAVILRNVGWTTVTVLGVGESGPGFELRGVDGTFPVTLRPGDEVEVQVNYQVTDCDAVTREPWPMPVRVDRPWGEMTMHIHMPPYRSESRHHANDPLYQLGLRSADISWHRWLAEQSCHPDPDWLVD